MVQCSVQWMRGLHSLLLAMFVIWWTLRRIAQPVGVSRRIESRVLSVCVAATSWSLMCHCV